MSQTRRSKFDLKNEMKIEMKLTFPITIAVINTNKASFSGVDEESSYSVVMFVL
jgi:hypothetical protein